MSDKEKIKETEEQCDCENCKCEDCNCEDCKCEDGECKCEDCKCEGCDCKDGECKCEDDECKCEECDCEKEFNIPEEIKNLAQELAKEKAERLSLLAEFVNYKKRIESEKGEFVVYANGAILKQVIEIVDDFERALKDISKSEKGLNEGVNMIVKKLTNLISNSGLSLIEVKEGDEFEPQTMEAITTVKVDDEKKQNKVIEVLQKGYTLRQSGSVFKHAVVVIGKKA